MAGNVRHSGFESRAYGRERRKYTVRYFSRPYRRNGSRKADNGGSMLAKMGICALLAGLVLLSEFLGGREGIVEASSDLSRANDDSIGGDYLGKLRFVELPGIIQVFSSDAKLRVGVEYKSWQLNEDKTIITVSGIEGKALPAPSDGTIKTVTGEDDEKRIDTAAALLYQARAISSLMHTSYAAPKRLRLPFLISRRRMPRWSAPILRWI